MKTIEGVTMIAIAKAIAGSAIRIRFAVSPEPRRRGSRGGRGGGGGSSSNISSSKRSTLIAAPPPSRPRSEPSLPGLVLGQRGLEGGAVEVGPELLAEDQLRVGALPEQVVGDPLLAA